MTDYSIPASELLPELHRQAVLAVASAGDWLTGRERLAVWLESRDSRTNPLDLARRAALSPTVVAGAHHASDELSTAAVEVVHRVTSDPGRLTRAWADPMIAALGEEVYTELVGVTAIVSVLDHFSVAVAGEVQSGLPEPEGGDPARLRPADVGDVGAWVSQTLDKTRANVSRTLSLVPVTQTAWRRLVDSHYSRGSEFFDLSWDRGLSRPQVELLAARSTVLNECFY